MKRVLLSIWITIILVSLIWGLGSTQVIARLDRLSSNPNPLIRHFSPTWRSLKKIVDLPYIISGLFTRSVLPVYEIKLGRNDIRNLLDHLPNYPEENRLYDNMKQTVKAEFSHGMYKTADAKIRYRGNSPNHWNAIKKSWQVNLPQSSPLNGRTSLRFFIGEDKGWVKAMFWKHLGDKLGVMTLASEPVRLSVNKRDVGVYILVEGWEKALLEGYGKPPGPLFSVKNFEGAGDRLVLSALDDWYDRNAPQENVRSYPELVRLLTITASAPKEIFGREIDKVLDTDALLRWTAMAILAGDFNQSNFDNLNFYLNKTTGKIEPIFFDEHFAPIDSPVDLTKHRLASRLLAEEAYQKRFVELVETYVSNQKNLEDDLAFYDTAAGKIIPEIDRDTAKIQTSYEARAQIQMDREIYQHNFLALRAMLESGGIQFKYANEKYPL